MKCGRHALTNQKGDEDFVVVNEQIKTKLLIIHVITKKTHR